MLLGSGNSWVLSPTGSVWSYNSLAETVVQVMSKPLGWIRRSGNQPLTPQKARPPPSDDDLVFDAWAACRRDPGKRGKMPPQPWRGTAFADLDCGEDSFIVTESVLGVADGVGSWRRLGINSGVFSNQLLQNVSHFVDLAGETDPLALMQRAYDKIVKNREVTGGSSTACLASLSADGTLKVANLGDSGLMVIRDGKCHFHMEECSYRFNTPYQLAAPGLMRDQISNRPSDSKLKQLPLQEGDIVVLGSDGLFDNLFPDEIAKVASLAKFRKPALPFGSLFNPVLTVQDTAALLERQTYSASTDRSRLTPFATEASAAGAAYMGGKMDDITVIVAKVLRRRDKPPVPLKP